MGAVHAEELSDKTSAFLYQTTFAVEVQLTLVILDATACVKLLTHVLDTLLLLGFELLHGFVDVVLHPGEVLLGRVTEGEDVGVLCENLVLKVLFTWWHALGLTSFVRLVVNDRLLKVEGVSSR